MNGKAQLLCAWCGPAFTLLYLLGFVVLAKFIPPPHPLESAQEIKDFYVDNVDAIRIGMLVDAVAVALIAPFGMALAARLRGAEQEFPVLTFVQLGCVAVGTTVAVMIPLVWGVAAFRPDEYAADTIRMLNDAGWFLFLFTWPIFSVWFIALGILIMSDRRLARPYPRWAAYLNFWTAFIFVPAGFIIFFKTGPLAFNGLLALYVATGTFFVWVMVMSWLTIKAIKTDLGSAEADVLPNVARAAEHTPATVISA